MEDEWAEGKNGTRRHIRKSGKKGSGREAGTCFAWGHGLDLMAVGMWAASKKEAQRIVLLSDLDNGLQRDPIIPISLPSLKSV